MEEGSVVWFLRLIAMEMLLFFVIRTLKLCFYANLQASSPIYLNSYFLYFFNCLMLFLPIANKVMNRSDMGAPDARPGYFADTI